MFTGGNGVNSHWVQVQNTWQGPGYDPTSSSATALDGISSLQDANAALGLTSGSSGFMRSANAVMSTVNAGNDLYNSLYGATWGMANMPPLFNTGDPNQENYAGHITGYLAVTTPGQYNIGVLADDGFSFTIFGANGSESMSLDGLNSHDRYGFGTSPNPNFSSTCDCNLDLGQGLYRFDLVGYNRLEAGVLNLGWWVGPNNWAFQTIPQGNLFTAPVPLPAALWLMASGLVGLLGLARRRAS